ncbi:hypothetical protein Cgig2_013916 [Carnegiea gigantea]|uniref:APO domain-containing protein n=1 Tax=Carnegiea gigantea TaxID=171969 RepID=A0A9Q1JN45_9CARY|nr:hypothetical protein Cgig2_005411 [Carnegiea gigantea]KAJ8425570.1 hypothetical protein Cgig2_013916 [Carnegiea gigantea]
MILMPRRWILAMLLGKKRKYSLWVRNCHYHAYQQFNEDRASGGEIHVTPFGGETNDPLHTDLPEPRQSKSERKPYPTPMKTLIRRAKEEKELRKSNPCRVLEHPPDNGLLVPELVPVSRQVNWARESLIIGISKLLPFINVLKCRLCPEVHIGPVGHEIRTCTGPRSGFRSAMHDWIKGGLSDVVYFPKCFHLYDRVGKPRVTHDERFNVPRMPAIVELCIQAGINVEKYPVRRRTKPVYCMEGRIVDVDAPSNECDFGHAEDLCNQNPHIGPDCWTKVDDVENDSEVNHIHPLVQLDPEQGKGLRDISIGTMASWLDMISGARKIMDEYSVWTCGYCPEVQVGPKGHKVRMCKASKHQSRDGLHAWQEATIDDLVGPNYVWHVRNPCGPPLRNNLKRYYGKAPAVVELCVQAGAPVPDQYRSMMRLDVVPPELDEVDLVA